MQLLFLPQMGNILLDLSPHPIDLCIDVIPEFMEGHFVYGFQLSAFVPLMVFYILD